MDVCNGCGKLTEIYTLDLRFCHVHKDDEDLHGWYCLGCRRGFRRNGYIVKMVI